MGNSMLSVLWSKILLCWIVLHAGANGQSQFCQLYDENNTVLTSTITLSPSECSFNCGTSPTCMKFSVCKHARTENCTDYTAISRTNCGHSASNIVCILFSKEKNACTQPSTEQTSTTAVESTTVSTEITTEHSSTSITTTTTVSSTTTSQTTEQPTTTTTQAITTTQPTTTVQPTTTAQPTTTTAQPTTTQQTTTTQTASTSVATTTTPATTTTTTVDPMCISYPALCQ